MDLIYIWWFGQPASDICKDLYISPVARCLRIIPSFNLTRVVDSVEGSAPVEGPIKCGFWKRCTYCRCNGSCQLYAQCVTGNNQ